MISYKLGNSDEEIQISSLDELRKKDFWNDIVYLDCSGNEITNLDNLPPNLHTLYCWENKITNLDNLPINLQTLYCYRNKITNLDNLPPNLHTLYCWENKIINLDNLPPNLQKLYCEGNKITNLDNSLPYSLKILNHKKYVKPNVLNLYLNKTIDIQQLEEHFELINSCCEICKTKTNCINKCPHKFCIDCIIEMYKANKRTDCCICGKSFV
jgi:Leucine-rich repeat (LRR) protein